MNKWDKNAYSTQLSKMWFSLVFWSTGRHGLRPRCSGKSSYAPNSWLPSTWGILAGPAVLFQGQRQMSGPRHCRHSSQEGAEFSVSSVLTFVALQLRAGFFQQVTFKVGWTPATPVQAGNSAARSCSINIKTTCAEKCWLDYWLVK